MPYSPRTGIDPGSAEGPFDVVNDHAGAMRVEPAVAVTALKTIRVAEHDYERARELIEDYLASTGAP